MDGRFELVFMPLSAEVSHCSRNRILFLKLTSFGASAGQYIRPFLWISPLSTIVADVSSQFSTSQLCNMMVLAARLMDTLFGRQIVLSMHQKMDKENSPGAKVDYF